MVRNGREDLSVFAISFSSLAMQDNNQISCIIQHHIQDTSSAPSLSNREYDLTKMVSQRIQCTQCEQAYIRDVGIHAT